jgi:glycosyltransferase involved in cell wall biosynthesis
MPANTPAHTDPVQSGEPAAPARSATLRVAIFSDSLSERNGAGAYYADLATQLRPQLGALELFQPAIKKRLLKFALPLPGDATQKLIFPNLVRIRRDFARLRPHLVIAVTPGPFGLLGLWLARRQGSGMLTAFHTHFEGLVQLYGNTWFFRFAHAYLVKVNQILCRRSASVLINNPGLESTVLSLGAPRVDLMGTPLALPFIETPPAPPTGTLQRILFAGRLAPEKNLLAVVTAARELPHIRFVLAGEGPLRAQIAEATRELPNVRMTGWLDREALLREMDAASILLLPSHMETFGTVALEAMARGRPAMVAAGAGIHSWPTLSGALFTVAPDQPLAGAIRQLEQMRPEDWRQRAELARRAALELNNRTIEEWVRLVGRYARADALPEAK